MFLTNFLSASGGAQEIGLYSTYILPYYNYVSPETMSHQNVLTTSAHTVAVHFYTIDTQSTQHIVISVENDILVWYF